MKKLIVFAALAAMLAAYAIPAHAATGDFGGITSTSCTTRLDDFPNAPPADPNHDDCDSDTGASAVGSVPAVAIDHAAGVLKYGSDAFILGGQGALRTTFSYDENCSSVPSGQFPAFGSASGNFLLKGSFANGGNGTLMSGFAWTRTGLVATITFGKTLAATTDVPSGSKVIAAGLAGFDTNNDYTNVEKPAPSNFAGNAVGLLQIQVNTVNNNVCPAVAGTQPQVVTAHALGEVAGG